jgi:hypothetical protein
MRTIVSSIDCRPPAPDEWIRVRAGVERVPVTVALRDPDTGRLYLVGAELWDQLGERIEWVCPRACINHDGRVFIWPVPAPGPGGDPHSWVAAAGLVADLAEQRWIRLEIDREREQYRLATEGGSGLPEPAWPAAGFVDVLRDALRGCVIATADHPLIRKGGLA